jgi:hypothetical protein
MSSKIRVEREKRFSAHHMLLGAARAALEDAESRRPGWFYAELVAMTMASLAVEAVSNAIGERVVRDWKDFESAKPIAKLRLICQQLDVLFDERIEPWATVRWLAKFRNDVAHAKPELVKETYTWSRAEYERREDEGPKSKLEKKVTIGNARRAVCEVRRVKDILCDAVPEDMRQGLFSDAWTGSATSVPDA